MIENAYKKRYKMRAVGQDGLNIVVSMPRVVIEREAERYNLSVTEFLERFRAIAQFNNFDGIFYKFEEMASESTEPTGVATESPREG